MFEDTPLKEPCKKVIIEAPPTSLKLSVLVSHASFESVPTLFTISAPSPSLGYPLVKPMDDYVITDLNDDLGLENMDIK